MFFRRIPDTAFRSAWLLTRPILYAKHTQTCPTKTPAKDSCAKPPSKAEGGGSVVTVVPLKRAMTSGKCRMGFIPEEWFLFFRNITGVSGPYIFGLAWINYWVSKEIYVMEHEYYSGLPIVLLLYLIMTRAGPGIGAYLDKDVDAIAKAWQDGRDAEIKFYDDTIKAAKTAQWSAQGQEILMQAKKENIAMQIEAAYRARVMGVYDAVRGRMDFQIQKYISEGRIQQRWMIQWILNQVMQSITPEFEKLALDEAIKDLEAVASRVK